MKLTARNLLTVSFVCGMTAFAFAAPPTAAKPVDHVRIVQNLVRAKDAAKVTDAVSAALADPQLDADKKSSVCLTAARFFLQNKKEKEGLDWIGKARTMPGISPAAQVASLICEAEYLFRKNFPGGGIVYDDSYIQEAEAVYRKALALNDLPNSIQIDLYARIAETLLEQKKVAAANAELEQACKLPGLTEKELENARSKYAKVLWREHDYIAAEKMFRLLDNDLETANCLAKTKGPEAGEAWLKQKNASFGVMANYFKINGLKDSSVSMYRQIVENSSIKMSERWNALRSLINILVPERIQDAINTAKKFESQFVKAYPGYYSQLFLSWPNKNYLSGKFMIDMVDVQLASPSGVDGLPGKKIPNEYLSAVIRSGDTAKLMKILDLVDPKQEKVEYRLLKLMVSDAKRLDEKQVMEILKNEKPEDQAKYLAEAAKNALLMDREETGRRFWALRSSLLVETKTPVLTCQFLENGPRSIPELLNCAYVKDSKNQGVLNRKYGQNLKFLLETDASTTGRQVTSGGDPAAFTTFTASCDEDGIKLLFIMPCTPERSKAIRNGYQAMGGFENYLTMGPDTPYHTCLINCPPNPELEDNFRTQYDNVDFRGISKKSGNSRISFQTYDDKVVMLHEIDWSAVLRLPLDGDVWEFETIHWERGGWSWGGSKSVHNRSSFGHLVFAGLTPEHRTAIKRRLLVHAKRAYQAEWNSRNNGSLENWLDPELGDPAFAKAELTEIKEKYDAYIARIKENMTDAEVNAVFDEAYLFLINTKFMGERIRSNYLLRKMTGD